MRRALTLAAVTVAAGLGVRALSAWLSAALDDAFDVPLDAPAAHTARDLAAYQAQLQHEMALSLSILPPASLVTITGVTP